MRNQTSQYGGYLIFAVLAPKQAGYWDSYLEIAVPQDMFLHTGSKSPENGQEWRMVYEKENEINILSLFCTGDFYVISLYIYVTDD